MPVDWCRWLGALQPPQLKSRTFMDDAEMSALKAAIGDIKSNRVHSLEDIDKELARRRRLGVPK